MKLTLRCQCGKLQGQVESSAIVARATCYCKDCQAYAHFLKQEAAMLNPAGGTEIAATLPAAVHFTQGLEHLACMSLSEHGLLRWYASCCHTPIGNTPRDPKTAYVGLLRPCLAESPVLLDAELGLAEVALQTASANDPVRSTPFKASGAILKIARMILGARLSGRYRDNPFFNAGTGMPIRPPQALMPEQRASLD